MFFVIVVNVNVIFVNYGLYVLMWLYVNMILVIYV